MKLIRNAIIVGVVLTIFSYLSILLLLKVFPAIFEDYYNPIFISSGLRDLLFYLHGFVLALALAWIWHKTKSLYHGAALIRAFEFGFMYTLTAFIPIFWITLSAMDLSLSMIVSWIIYGAIQTIIAGFIFAKIDP